MRIVFEELDKRQHEQISDVHCTKINKDQYYGTIAELDP